MKRYQLPHGRVWAICVCTLCAVTALWVASACLTIHFHFGERIDETGECWSGFGIWIERGAILLRGNGYVHRQASREPWIITHRWNWRYFGLAELPWITGRRYENDKITMLEPAVEWCVGVPFWCIALALMLVTEIVRRKRYAFPPGTCWRCGYDLRATPDRCPECGTTVERAKAGSAQIPSHASPAEASSLSRGDS